MENKNQAKNPISEVLDEFNEIFEDVEVKLKEGAKEAREIFERERSHFKIFIEDQKHRWLKPGLMTDPGYRKLMDKLHALSGLLSDMDAGSEAAFKDWKEIRLRVTIELEFLMREFYPEMNDTERPVFELLKTDLEVYRKGLIDAVWGATSGLTEAKVALAHRIAEAVKHVEEEEKIDWSHLEGFKDEIKTSFEHLKKAFDKLVK